MILVRGPWDETPGSLGLPFDVNRSQSFSSVCRRQVEFNHVCVHDECLKHLCHTRVRSTFLI